MSSVVVFTLCAIVALAAVGGAQTTSPEVHADHTVTFRFRDPGASKVELSLEGKDSVAMTKDSDGLWTFTTLPLTPDIYGYNFVADGISLTDPQNSLTKPNLIWQSSAVLVPGDPPQPWEVQDVPHGVLHHTFYKSAVIGDQRDYFVYTPPGYDPRGPRTYPVLYLLHGYSDMASGWSAVGMANVILDNLIAQGKAKPMLIVMPLGYGIPNFASATGRGFGDAKAVTKNYENFRAALLHEVIPQVEKDYRVAKGKNDRAIAGLSMGGAETLFTGLNNLDKFAYVGAFSSGGLSDDYKADFPNLKPADANKLKVLWISCGVSDGLITSNRNLVKWLRDQKINVQAIETPGRHEWPVWRRNLIAFSSELFK